jgi:hypothetical protein
MSKSKTTRKARKDATPKPFSRSGLHRLECSCGNYTYSTVAPIETYGMPMCARCSAPFEPARLELALLLGLDDAPVLAAFMDRTEDKDASQLRRLGRKGVDRKLAAGTLNSMTARAFDEIVAEQRQQSRERRLNALTPTVEAMPF